MGRTKGRAAGLLQRRSANAWASVPRSTYSSSLPTGTPRAIVEKLNTDIVKILHQSDTRERLAAMGGEPASATPEQAAEFLKNEYERWGRVIRDGGIKGE